MKKMLVAFLAALSLLAFSEQQASAWSKFNFGVGLNCSYEGSGNTFLWGLLKGSPNPNCCNADGCCPGGACQGAFPPPGFDGGMPVPSDSVKPMPPEKIAPPTPVKPASYSQAQQTQQSQQSQEHQQYQQYLKYQQYLQSQQQNQQQEENSADEENSGYYYPSYYYGR